MIAKGSETPSSETLQLQGDQLFFLCVAKEHAVAHNWIK